MSGEIRNSAHDLDTRDELVFRESSGTDEPNIRRVLSEAHLSFSQNTENGAVATGTMGAIHVHLLEKDGEVLAVLQWRDLGEEAEILDVAVPASHRRRGFGLVLMQRFVSLARTRGVHNIFLEVRESNWAAINLYRHAGFSTAGRRPIYYQQPEEAALLLHLTILG